MTRLRRVVNYVMPSVFRGEGPFSAAAPYRASPTMADVAAMAGVSHQTVSRVLNHHPSVSAKTRQKVQEAITTLGYRRNLAARTLATGNSRTIGVLVSTSNLAGPSESLLAIEQTARSERYWVSMASLQSGEADEVLDVISHFIDQGVDGIIAVARTQMTLDVSVHASSRIPLVVVTPGAVPATMSSAEIDQVGGATQAMAILKGLGHTRIAHISGPASDLHAVARASVWRKEVAPDHADLIVEGDWTPATGYCTTLSLLAKEEPPTAIFAGNDRMGFGVLRALNERGLRVPQDMSVIGFDDIEGADCAIPPLTTVRQDHHGLGRAAMELLLEAIDGQPARSVEIPAQVIVRASTAAAPTTG